MNNIIKYVRNRNNGGDYNDLINDSNTFEDITIDHVLQSSDGVDLSVAINGTNNNKYENRDENKENKTFTIDEAVEKIGFGRFQMKLSLLTGLAWMADAMEMMVLSILAPALECGWSLNEWQKAAITMVVFCGMMISSPIWGKICDRFGRRICLLFCTIFTFVFGFISSFSPSFIWLLIFRGFVGFGIGGAPQSVTLYAEFLPSKHRARCVVFSNFFWSLGACFEVLLAILVMPTLGWRWLLGLSAVPLLIFIIFCIWLPESPRFHLTSNRPDLATSTLKRIAEDNKATLPEGSLAIVKSDLRRGQFKDLISKDHRKTSFMLWFIWFANAFSYYGIVLLTTELFQIGGTCGVTDIVQNSTNTTDPVSCYLQLNDYLDLLWTTIAEFPGLIITIIIIEVFGRKKTMSSEFIFFSLFTFFINICVQRSVLIFFLFVSRCFISGAFQAAYVYTPEYYPTVIRAVGLGTCSAVARIGAIMTPFVAQVLLKISPYAAISIYGSVALLASIMALLLPVETKGRDLKETSIDALAVH